MIKIMQNWEVSFLRESLLLLMKYKWYQRIGCIKHTNGWSKYLDPPKTYLLVQSWYFSVAFISSHHFKLCPSLSVMKQASFREATVMVYLWLNFKLPKLNQVVHQKDDTLFKALLNKIRLANIGKRREDILK